jgi:hypothetical protein
MRNIAAVVLLAMLLCVIPFASVEADWYEDFESYLAGSNLHGQGGWEGYLDDPSLAAYVSDLYAYGGAQSVEVGETTAIAHPFSGYDSGVWALTCWVFVPLEYTGETDFILFNTYPPPTESHPFWSADLVLDGATDLVYWLYDPSIATPLIRNAWVQIKFVIDLDNDTQTVFYADTTLAVLPWIRVVGGALDIAAVLMGTWIYGGPLYYDDFSLVPAIQATESTSWSQLKSLYR